MGMGRANAGEVLAARTEQMNREINQYCRGVFQFALNTGFLYNIINSERNRSVEKYLFLATASPGIVALTTFGLVPSPCAGTRRFTSRLVH